MLSNKPNVTARLNFGSIWLIFIFWWRSFQIGTHKPTIDPYFYIPNFSAYFSAYNIICGHGRWPAPKWRQSPKIPKPRAKCWHMCGSCIKTPKVVRAPKYRTYLIRNYFISQNVLGRWSGSSHFFTLLLSFYIRYYTVFLKVQTKRKNVSVDDDNFRTI